MDPLRFALWLIFVAFFQLSAGKEVALMGRAQFALYWAEVRLNEAIIPIGHAVRSHHSSHPLIRLQNSKHPLSGKKQSQENWVALIAQMRHSGETGFESFEVVWCEFCIQRCIQSCILRTLSGNILC